MSAFAAMLRKQAAETKWILGLMAASFLGLGVLMAWLTARIEGMIGEGRVGPGIRRMGFLRGLGGPEFDYSTTALEVCWWNHPVVVLTVLGWAVARGSVAVAGEIERGTLDLTLSRPVSRAAYLAAQVVFAALGLLVLVAALVAGIAAGPWLYQLEAPPGLRVLSRPATMLLTLGLAVYGYTLALSALDRLRWRPGTIALGATLGGLIALSVAPQFETYEWYLERLSVFQYYAPVTVALKGEPLAHNATVLSAVAAVAIAVAFAAFLARDLPSNS